MNTVGVRARTVRLVAQLALLVAGVLIMAYPFTIGAAPGLMCRDQVLRPGEVCAKADGSAVQSYEARARAAANAMPVVVVLGALVAGFGGYLLWSGARSKTQSA